MCPPVVTLGASPVGVGDRHRPTEARKRRAVHNWNIEALLKQMCEKGASDMLLTVGTPPQLRVNGLLEPLGTQRVDAEATRRLVHSLLTERQAQTLDERKNLDFSKGFEGLSRFRFSAYYQRDSLALAVRVIPFSIPSFESLALPGIVQDFASRPHGLVLITGPAGSGKSTTMAAMIDHINHSRRVHIVCIEDPIEYLHAHALSTIDQREIGEDVHTFDEALRSVFRQSPDVIMVGEMRDLPTMQLALSLAETGHLILATLHTQDATNSISRIVDSFPAVQQAQVYTQLSLVLVGVITQQLIPTRDNTGRILACEIMNVNNAIRNLIREMQIQQVYSVIQTGRAEGMIAMNDSLRLLCEQNLIDADTAIRKSPRPKELMRQLKADPRV